MRGLALARRRPRSERQLAGWSPAFGLQWSQTRGIFGRVELVLAGSRDDSRGRVDRSSLHRLPERRAQFGQGRLLPVEQRLKQVVERPADQETLSRQVDADAA